MELEQKKKFPIDSKIEVSADALFGYIILAAKQGNIESVIYFAEQGRDQYIEWKKNQNSKGGR